MIAMASRPTGLICCLLILSFNLFLSTTAGATTDYFIFPRGNSKNIYCNELKIDGKRIQCTTNSIFMEFDRKDIRFVEVIHNGKSLQISHLNKKTMEEISEFVSVTPDSPAMEKTIESFIEKAAGPYIDQFLLFQEKLSLQTAAGKIQAGILFCGIFIFTFGSLTFIVAAFRIGIIWGLACVFIPGASMLFLFFHFKTGRKPFAISILGLALTLSALIPVYRGGTEFYLKNNTGKERFQCRGKTYCSEMTSCTEAKYYLQNCPGTKLDGNHDNIPCEKQWCN
jgi:hypothetical protein